jgi:hypothetical protein
MGMNRHFYGKPEIQVVFTGILIGLLCVVACPMLMKAATVGAAESLETPEEIDIENNVYEVDRKGSVWFPHLDHAEGYDIDCHACHHEYQGSKNIWQEGQPVKKCLSCHDPARNEGRLKKLRTAFHGNCKGCHKKLAKEGETTAPYKKCTDCHEKK